MAVATCRSIDINGTKQHFIQVTKRYRKVASHAIINSLTLSLIELKKSKYYYPKTCDL